MEGRHRLIVAIVAAVIATAATPASAAPPHALPSGRAGEPASWIVSGPQGRAVVPRARAGALAAALDGRGRLRWAEPNRRVHRSVSSAPLAWRDRLGLAGLPGFPVRPDGPALALLDTPPDLGHPALRGALVTARHALTAYDEHGTSTAAAAAATGAGGVLGVWPGMRISSYAFPQDAMTCAKSAELIDRAVADGAATISMSYGSEAPCFSELAALQHAIQHGVVLVAAAGNAGTLGDPREYPGAFPHVLTIAALGSGDRAAPFSTAGTAIDLAAPGLDVLTAVPPAFDPDEQPDGFARLSGTSLAAPMVAAAATAVRAARPGLTGDQIAALLCVSARDVGPVGWDRHTGWGVPDVAAALRRRAPAIDPAEPNDDIVWVDGIGLGRPAAPVWTGGRARTLRATVTAHDDPADVYPVRQPARSTLRLTLSGRAGLRVLSARALDIADRSSLLARSHGARVTLRNPGRARLLFVAVTHDRRSARTAPYRLTIRNFP